MYLSKKDNILSKYGVVDWPLLGAQVETVVVGTLDHIGFGTF